MLISFTPAQALDVARMTWAGERRKGEAAARPIIGSLFLEWEPDGKGLQVTVVATDSFMLAYRQFVTVEGHAVEDGEKEKGSALIHDLPELERALKTAAKGDRTVVMAFEERSVEIGDIDGSSVRKLDLTDGTFPNYRQLVPEAMLPLLDKPFDNKTNFIAPEPVNGQNLISLKPALLARIAKLTDEPLVLVGAETVLKPFVWGAVGQPGPFLVLQMPFKY